jgi:hypothetical protein
MLTKGGVPVICARLKALGSRLPFGDGSEFHYRLTERIATFHLSDFPRDSILHAPDGEILCRIGRYELPGFPVHMNMRFPKKDLPDLSSRCPRKLPDGRWAISFGVRNVIPSCKNILLKDSDDVPYLLSVKVAENEMRVDANVAIDARIVFAFGIQSML